MPQGDDDLPSGDDVVPLVDSEGKSLFENDLVDHLLINAFVERIQQLSAHHKKLVTNYRRVEIHIQVAVVNVDFTGGTSNGWP